MNNKVLKILNDKIKEMEEEIVIISLHINESRRQISDDDCKIDPDDKDEIYNERYRVHSLNVIISEKNIELENKLEKLYKLKEIAKTWSI